MNNMTRTALIIVDVQNDFCPGGSLAVPRGNEVVSPLNKWLQKADLENWVIVATRDWHPKETTHFLESGAGWPVHCVKGTPGAEFHPDLNLYHCYVVSKGMGETEDAYSGFAGTCGGVKLGHLLRTNYVKRIFIGGLATDYCVKATALDAKRLGFEVYLILDACRAVDVKPGDGERAIEEMRVAGVIVTTTEEVLNETR